MNYVLCSGGLGNQMFQYAFYHTLKERNIPVVFDTSYFRHTKIHNGYELEKCFGIEDGQTEKDHFSLLYRFLYHYMAKMKMGQFINIRLEIGKNFIRRETVAKNEVLYGFWQGATYFKGYEDSIKNALQFKSISTESKIFAKKMAEQKSVAVHVRRGDYVNSSFYIDLVKTHYYNRALNEIVQIAGDGLKYYIFSDDPKWCKLSGLFPDDAEYVTFNCGGRAYEDMYLMSKADYLVIANSSFSWWAGFLGEHEKILRPSKYTVNWNNKKDEMLYPADWIKIQIDD